MHFHLFIFRFWWRDGSLGQQRQRFRQQINRRTSLKKNMYIQFYLFSQPLFNFCYVPIIIISPLVLEYMDNWQVRTQLMTEIQRCAKSIFEILWEICHPKGDKLNIKLKLFYTMKKNFTFQNVSAIFWWHFIQRM